MCAATRDRHRFIAGRQISIRFLLGNRGVPAVRRVRSIQSEKDWLSAHWRDCSANAPPEESEATVGWRTANGRSESRRQTGLLHKLTLLHVGRAILSRRCGQLD